MTFSSPEAFLDHVAANESLQAEFSAATSESEILRILQREGVTFGPTEIRDAFLERYGSELNEEQLAAIAGGVDGALIGAVAGVTAGAFIGTAIAVGSAAAAAA